MRRSRIHSITDVAERHLCTGCGGCAFVQPEAISIVDDLDAGRRPVVGTVGGRELPTVQAMGACPGIGLEHERFTEDTIPDLREKWGPVLEVWEGYAADPEIRYAASSGGVASALAVHALEAADMHGLLHIRARPDAPYLNETVLSTQRDQILAATGSRYAPASPCDRLDLVAASPRPCVFIGKPCDVAATWKIRRLRDDLDAKLGLTVAIFCAGTPTTRGTLEMLDAMGLDPDRLVALRYRGNGWPGEAVARVRSDDGTVRTERLTYDESWGGILQRHRQWRCYVCADHTGEFADVAVGDPWYQPTDAGDPGRSLILVRTERGRTMLHAALRRGDIRAQRVPSHLVATSQPGLRNMRGEVGGRVTTLRAFGIPVPKYRGFPQWRIWWRDLSFRDKLRSTVGTVRRIRRKRLWRRAPVRPWQGPVR